MKKKKKIGVFLSVSVAVFLFGVLIFFTFLGDQVYEKITKNVQIMNTSSTYKKEYFLVPRTAFTNDNTIYLVSSEKGFERTIYRILEKKAEILFVDDISGDYVISKNTVNGYQLAIDAKAVQNAGLTSGDKVIPKK